MHFSEVNMAKLSLWQSGNKSDNKCWPLLVYLVKCNQGPETEFEVTVNHFGGIV